jgi:hypothetical protein
MSQQQQHPRPGTEAPRILQLPANFDALGAAVDFLVADKIFGAMPSSRLVSLVKHQLAQKCQICALRGKVMIAYCGWVLITKEIGDKWFQGEVGQYGLPTAPPDRADAAALTIVRIVEPNLVLPLMRECRRLHPGKRIYIRRDYGDRKKQARQSHVRS